MTGIVIPKAPLQGGRAPGIPAAVPDRIGGAVADFGQRMANAGAALETDRLTRERQRARIDMTRDLGAARLDLEQVTDPDEIDAAWSERSAEIRDQVVGGVEEKNRETVGLDFEELNTRHAIALGGRANRLRSDQRSFLAQEQVREALRQAPALDRETRGVLGDQITDSYAALVVSGDITEAEAGSQIASAREALDVTALQRRISDDPEGALTSLDAGEFDFIPSTRRESWRSRIVSAQRRAASVAETQARQEEEAFQAQLGDQLDDVIAAARHGRVSADQNELLQNPNAIAHPKFDEAAAAVQLQRDLPEFARLPPDEMQARIKAERARPVGKQYEARVLDEMEKVYDASVKAWNSDPLTQARNVGMTPPAELPDLNPANAQEFGAALVQRRLYGRSLEKLGYVAAPVFFAKAERDDFKKMAAVDGDPGDRALLAGMIASAFRDDAPAALAEIGGDEVFEHMGGLMASGGSPALVEQAFSGQQALANKTVQLPSNEVRREILARTFGAMFSGADAGLAKIWKSADAIYASQAFGLDPKLDIDEAEALYARSIQQAIGAEFTVDGVTGGAQEVNGATSLLPIGVSADEVEATLGAFAPANLDTVRDFLGIEISDPVAMDLWERSSVGGGAPYFAGKPLSPELMSRVQLLAVGPDTYRLRVQGAREMLDVTNGDTLEPFVFRLNDLIRDVRQAAR